jgi:hypothetical protein
MTSVEKYPHYFKDVKHLDSIDVYRVLELFEVSDPCVQHAVKKLLCLGKRGAKNGLEIDENDEHSMHFIVVKNLELSRRRRGTGKAAIVACLRLIDNINNNELPVQTLFGNKGKLKDISGQQALEVSRFISRMSNDLEQLQVVANLFNTGLADANHRRMQAVYGVIEDDLQAKLHSKYKVPTKSLTELQSLEEYNKTKNMAVQIGTRAMTRRIGRDVLEELRLEPGGRRYWDLVA